MRKGTFRSLDVSTGNGSQTVDRIKGFSVEKTTEPMKGINSAINIFWIKELSEKDMPFPAVQDGDE